MREEPFYSGTSNHCSVPGVCEPSSITIVPVAPAASPNRPDDPGPEFESQMIPDFDGSDATYVLPGTSSTAAATQTGTDVSTSAQTLASAPLVGPFVVRITKVKIGGDYLPPWLDIGVRVKIDTYPTEEKHVDVPDIFGDPMTVDIPFGRDIPVDQVSVHAKIELVEYDWPNDTDHEVTVEKDFSNAFGTYGQEVCTTFDPNNENQWGLCYEVVGSVRPTIDYVPLLCPRWNANLIDANLGEDVYATTGIQQPAARFAITSATLYTEGGGFVLRDLAPLTEEGCFTIGTPDDWVVPASGTRKILDVHVRSEFAVHANTGASIWHVLTPDDKLLDLALGLPFKLNGDIPGWQRIGNWLVPPRSMHLASGSTMNALTRISAIVSQFLGTPDNGLVAGDYTVYANVACPGALNDVSCYYPSDHNLYIAPGTDPYLRLQHSRWKYIVAHEIGHMVQAYAVGNVGGGKYPPLEATLSPVCRCDDATFAPAHCLGSLSLYDSAASEGFGHFMATKLWNTPSNGEPVFGYYKHVTDDKCWTGAACQDSIHAGFKANGPPLRVPAKQPVRWRNTRCAQTGGSNLMAKAVEYDWLGFYLQVNRAADPTVSWSMEEITNLYWNMCGGRRCTGATTATWTNLDAAARRVSGGFVSPKYRQFSNAGRSYGVSDDLSP